MIWGEVVQKFLMHSTSLMQYNQKFYESPTITICFSHMTINGSTLVYGEDFYINYRCKRLFRNVLTFLIYMLQLCRNYNGGREHRLKEGEFTYINKSKEVLYFESVISSKMNVVPRCYKVTHNVSKENPTFMRQFFVRFRKEFETKSIPKMSIYFTSERNGCPSI